MPELTVVEWSALAAAALVVGFAKTAISGSALLAVAVFAAVLPARESTGTLLPLLIVGDLMGVALYRRHADWPMLRHLLPSVVVGAVVGTAFIARIDDQVMRRAIGALLLVLVGIHVVLRSGRVGESGTGQEASPGRGRPVAAALAGTFTGFVTMVANAAGPVMTLYLLFRRVPMMAFLGTGAWFFLIVNVGKVPFSVGLGLLDGESLLLDLVLTPAVLVGGAIGAVVIRRIEPDRFQALTTGLAAVSAVALLVG